MDADPGSKNRVGDFFVFTTCSDRVSWSQSVEAHQEIFTFDTTTVPGLYPVNFIDPYGLCADNSVKTTSISLFGASVALTPAAMFDISALRDSYGDKAIAIKFGAGVGVEGKVDLPSTSISVSPGDIRAQRGGSQETHIGLVGAITTDANGKVNGGGIGGVGGGHYWTYTFVIPLQR